MEILGYARPDGQLGIRNHVAIIYTTDCSMVVARALYDRFPVGTQLFGYPAGCQFREPPVDKIVFMGRNPSYAAVLVVGLGCEGTDADLVARRIGESGKPVESVKIQPGGGDLRTIERGSRIMMRFIQHASVAPRKGFPVAELIVGSKCAGSDATSGLVSNPLVGMVADRLIDQGATYMHGEAEELMGCADALSVRAEESTVAQDVREVISHAEEEAFARGQFQIGYGNILGGLTTIEEKSYGALAKSGSKPLRGVLRGFGRPPTKGYFLHVSPAGSRTFHGDPEEVSQFAACGAHLVLFTSGCGTTTGGLLPVIKVIANPHRMELIADNADLDATPVTRGERSLEEMAEELYQEVLSVAAGKLTKSEIYRHYEA